MLPFNPPKIWKSQRVFSGELKREYYTKLSKTFLDPEFSSNWTILREIVEEWVDLPFEENIPKIQFLWRYVTLFLKLPCQIPETTFVLD